LDAEYYKKEYLLNDKITAKYKAEKLKDLISKIDVGFVGTMVKYYTDKGIPLLQTKNINNFFVNDNERIQITKDFHNLLKKSQVNYEDILIARSGSFGKASIYLKKEIINSSDIIIIRANELKINPYYLVAYLNSKSGVRQMLRFASGGLQGHVNLTILEELEVSILSHSFQQKIEDIVKSAHVKREQSQTLYRQSEELLLETIGLKDFQPSQAGTNIKTFKESFLATGRLDAEYYQPKYEEIEHCIKKLPFDIVENICSHINYGTVPTSPYSESSEGCPYIKGMNLKNLKITGKLDRITNTEDLHDKFYTKEGDIVISQMGTVGDVGVISKEEENFLFASFTIRIRIKDKDKYNPYYVGLYIQNIAKEWYLLRNIAQASVRQNTDLPTIKNMYIPLIDVEIQCQIAELITQSFSLRRESERLLEDAKEMVEREIEGKIIQ
jgi:restriction endonuclease S subunit